MNTEQEDGFRIEGTISLRLRQWLLLHAGDHGKSSSRICGDFLRSVSCLALQTASIRDSEMTVHFSPNPCLCLCTEESGLSHEEDALRL